MAEKPERKHPQLPHFRTFADRLLSLEGKRYGHLHVFLSQADMPPEAQQDFMRLMRDLEENTRMAERRGGRKALTRGSL